jgi:hypothetical protein
MRGRGCILEDVVGDKKDLGTKSFRVYCKGQGIFF